MSLPDDVGDKETLTTSARSRCPAGALSGGYRSVALGIGSLAWVWLLSGLVGSLASTDGWFLALNGDRRLLAPTDGWFLAINGARRLPRADG